MLSQMTGCRIQPLAQPDGVAGRVAAGVIIEVGENVAALHDLFRQPFRPLTRVVRLGTGHRTSRRRRGSARMMTRAVRISSAPVKRLAPVLFLLSILSLKLLLAWRFHGYATGDDLEVLLTAAKYAWGLDYEPWGLRCLFYPLVFVWPVLKAAYLSGARDPALLSWLGTLPAAAVSTLSIALLYRLAKRWNCSEATARVAAFFYAFHWLSLGYGSMHYPRPISGACLLGAFLIVSRPRETSWSGAAAGVLAAAAFAVRWSEGVVLVPLLAWTWWKHRDGRMMARILVGFALGALLFVGLTDALTWGKPFASLAEFFRVHAPENRPSYPVHDQPFYWYGKTVLRWAGPLFPLLLLPAWRDRRARAPLSILAAIVLLLSFFQLKQWRFLQSGIPYLALSAALGWERLRKSGGPGRLLAAGALVLSVPLALERTLTLLSDKSQSAVAAARYIAALRPAPRVIALEQGWAYGLRIYLGNGPAIREIPVSRPLDPETLRRHASGADAVALYSKDASPDVRQTLAQLGFRQAARFKRDTSKESVVYLSGSPPRTFKRRYAPPPDTAAAD